MSSSYTPQTPSPRAKSRSKTSHLLRGGGGGVDNTTTPSRPTNSNITPESPMLLNALKLAARSGSGNNSSDSIDELSEEGFSPLPMSPSDERSIKSRSGSSSNNEQHSLASSYANSIEAMAATVEAAAINRQRPRKSPKKTPKKNKGGNNNSSHPHYEQMQYQGTRKQLFSSTNNIKKRVVPKLTAGHLVAIVILVPFVIMEAFLSVLVFTYNYNGISMSVVGDGLVTTGDNNNSAVEMVNLIVDDVAHQEQEQEVAIFDNEGEETDEENEVIPPPTIEDVEEGSDGVADRQQAEIENNEGEEEEDADVTKSQIVAMESMLKDALKKMNDGSNKDGKKAVETLCLTVWSRGVEALSLANENDDQDNDSLNALAVDAQRCLGGAELAFLTKDVNIDSVRKSRVIFESLSDLDPDNASVRAGLGTSLLILGVMKEDESVVKLAMFHLKAASSLCQKGAVEAQPQSIFQSDASAMSAAILHNLALASISLGDDVSSVALLLRAGAIRREDSAHSVNLFWNCSHRALLTIEQQAALMGAKRTRRQKKKTKSKIPFLSDRFAVKEATA
mmetsp:Transcript_30228/g.60717  ORF Transcript_30228/g.60717 Transcript_30228/m.60717 type:complete len:563 (+) Transcript_30228:28-1716(+)